MSITPVYAGLVALLFVFLSIRVIGARRAARVGLGDGGNRLLLRRQRAHGNCAEYAPLAIVLMALAELQGTPPLLLHVIGIVLIAGRLVHAYGLSQEPEPSLARTLGMALTFAAIIIGALANLGLGSIAALLVA